MHRQCMRIAEVQQCRRLRIGVINSTLRTKVNIPVKSEVENMSVQERLDNVIDEYLQTFAQDPNDILKDNMTDLEKVELLEKAIQEGDPNVKL